MCYLQEQTSCIHHTDEVLLCSDYSAGFGGRYGVQADRMDKVSIKDEILYYCLWIHCLIWNKMESSHNIWGIINTLEKVRHTC